MRKTRNKEIVKLYKTSQWEKIRQEQLEADHFECQRCKHKGKYANVQGVVKYTKAQLVHHDFRVEKYPQYVYSRYVNGVRNMYSLCEQCHEIEHAGERTPVKQIEELNEERW